MPVVTHLEALEILDSRGRPTVQASCVLDGGVRASASVPSGSAPGLLEALELRDGDSARYRGLGCRKVVAHIEGEIRSALLNKRFADQTTLDRALLLLDGTEKKSRLGANAVLAVSVAFARAHAAIRGLPLYQHCADIMGHTLTRLPRPVVSLFSGLTPADERGDVRELAIVPAAATVDEALATAHAVYEAASALIARKYRLRPLSAEDGGLAAPFSDTDAMLAVAVDAIRAAEREPGRDVFLALDVGARGLQDSGWYRLDGEKLTPSELADRVVRWTERFPIVSVVDPLGDEDWEHWPELAKRLGERLAVLGDDLLCTCPTRLKRAIGARAA